MRIEITGGIGRQGGVIGRHSVGYHHQDAPLFRTPGQTAMRPQKGFAINILFEQFRPEHQPQRLPRPAPGLIRSLVKDMPQITQPAWITWFAVLMPGLAGLPAPPLPGGEA